jgi:hypothetical protein
MLGFSHSGALGKYLAAAILLILSLEFEKAPMKDFQLFVPENLFHSGFRLMSWSHSRAAAATDIKSRELK